MLLVNHPKCHATDIREFEDLLQDNAGGQAFDAAGSRRDFSFRVNMTPVNQVTVLWSKCNMHTRASYGPVTYLRHMFPLHKPMNIALNGDGFETCSHRLGHLIPDDIPWCHDNAADAESFTLRVEREILKGVLEAMIGETIGGDLHFTPVGNNDPHRALHLRNAMLEYAREIDVRDRPLSQVALAELEHGLVLRFLLYNRSNYSRFLERSPLSARNAQMRQVEEYLAANWEKPLDIARLAQISGVSARSVFRTFQKIYGISPQGFVRRVRLEQARSMLLHNQDGASVADVASRCGFQALGHFAAAYREMFGELPSETLRRK